MNLPRFDRTVLFLVLLLCAPGLPAGAQDADEGSVTVITSEKLTFDQDENHAVFEENVVVDDARMRLTTDLLTVFFTEDGDAERVEARGAVHIEQGEKQAWAGEADYDIESGEIELRDNPRVRQGRDMLSGETIRFFRDENKMICEPRARLVLYPDTGRDPNRLRIGE